MDTEKLFQKLERDPAYFFLVCMALICSLLVIIFSGCSQADENSMPLLTGMQDNDNDSETPPGPVAPIAAFSVDITDGIAPRVVRFTNESEGDISSFSWGFGDGTVSEEVNPVHIYSAPRDYTVTLTVSGPGGQDQISQENLVRVRLPEVDLAVTELVTEDFRVRAGTYIEFSAMIQNLGIDNAADCRIKLFLSSDSLLSEDDAETYDGLVESVPAGETSQVSFAAQVSSLTPVAYYTPIIQISVPDNTVDTDESDNIFTPGFLVAVCDVIKIAPSADTFISCDRDYAVFGSVPVLLTAMMCEEVEFDMILMAFDINQASLGVGSRIASSKLYLYTMNTKGDMDNNLEVFALENEWSEDSCCWEYSPIPGSKMWASANAPGIGWLEIDLTELTGYWLSGFVRNHGIALYTWADETAYAFYSREHEDPHCRPYLEIEVEPDMP
jgi:PKD repeat protein